MYSVVSVSLYWGQSVGRRVTAFH